jgi:hypothetical protein
MTAGKCPICPDQVLVADAEDPLIRHCVHCGGSLLAALGVPDDFRQTAAEPAGAVRTLVCPNCGGTMKPVALADLDSFLCVECGDAWMAGVAHPETAGVAESPETAATRLSRYLLYSVTLPERALRSTVGLTAGAARETAQFLVPQAFQSSKTYEVIVRNSLRFLCEDVGGVAKKADEVVLGKDFVARKAVGNFVDLAGWATLAVSPVWVMAIVSDVAYGSKTYVKELAEELRRKGLIDENSTINGVDDLLASVKDATGQTASFVDTPPLSVAELKETLAETRNALGGIDVRKVLPEAELKRYWDEMREISRRENVSFLGVSGALTMHALGKVGAVARGTFAGVRVAGGLFNRNVIGSYADALKHVRERGFYQTVRDSSAPYVEAVWNNFRVDRSTWTEELLSGRAIGKAWTSVRGWFSKSKPIEPDASPPAAPPAS